MSALASEGDKLIVGTEVLFCRYVVLARKLRRRRPKEQLNDEHDGGLENLKSDLDAVHMVAGIEDRRLGSAPPASKAEPPRSPQHDPRQLVQPQQPPSDFLARKISAVNVR